MDKKELLIVSRQMLQLLFKTIKDKTELSNKDMELLETSINRLVKQINERVK